MNDQQTSKARRLPSRGTRIHLMVVGMAIWILGGVTRMIFPAISQWWVVLVILVVAHLGLVIAFGSAVTHWIARRRAAALTGAGDPT